MNKDELKEYLDTKTWKFARTYAHKAPHWYTLREKWNDDKMFDMVVDIIRQQHGHTEWFWGKPFTVFEHKGWKYWTMGAPINETILINKAFSHTQYNTLAEQYDDLFGSEYHEENQEVFNMLKPSIEGRHIYDIGSGTGLLLDLAFENAYALQGYCGIDPSRKMVQISRRKHPNRRFVIDRFETYRTMIHKDNDTVAVSLFGSMNYVVPRYLPRISDYADKHFLMFYKEDYSPVTYKKTGIDLYNYKHTRAELEEIFPSSVVIEYNNYYIVLRR